MKYFQHDLLSREDDKIWELIDRHGLNGYGAWWVILEELYKAEEDGFKVDATETWLKRLAKSLEITDYRTLPRFLDTFAELGLINSQLWQEHIIFSAAVVARGDYYVRQKTLARERKQKERIARKVKAEELAEIIHQERLQQTEDKSCHEDVTRDNPEVTEDGRVMSRTNTDPYPYSSSNPSSEDLDPPLTPPGESGAASAPDETKTATVKTSEPAIAVDVLPEGSDQQLDILGSQQPAIPDQQNEESKGSGKPQDVKGSAPSSSKKNKRQRKRKEKPKEPKLTDAQIGELGELYNEYRPERWADYRPGVSKDRQRLTGYLFKFAGYDFERAGVILAEALTWVRLDPFWSGIREGKRGRFKNGRFRFVLEDSRFESWSESFSSTGLDLEAIRSSNLSDAELQEAQGQYQERQQQAEDPVMQKLRGMGLVA